MEHVPPLLIDQRKTETEVGIPVYVQEKLRRDGTFAPWLKVGRKVYYVREELNRWLAEQQAKWSGATDEG